MCWQPERNTTTLRQKSDASLINPAPDRLIKINIPIHFT